MRGLRAKAKSPHQPFFPAIFPGLVFSCQSLPELCGQFLGIEDRRLATEAGANYGGGFVLLEEG
jgi:hypothetical protein